MARTPYADPEAEKAYQQMESNSSKPSVAPLGGDGPEDDRLSHDPNTGNSMLRDRALGPHNVKVNRRNGYGR